MLKVGESREWQAQVRLPDNASPTFRSRFGRNDGALLAGLERPGHDGAESRPQVNTKPQRRSHHDLSNLP